MQNKENGMEEIKYWVWLSKIQGLGSRKINELLKIFHTPKGVWENHEEWEKIEGIGEKLVQKMKEAKNEKKLEEDCKRLQQEKIEIVSIQDNRYPKKLKEIYDAPVVLYAKGKIEILKEFSIAMIGCRQCSEYGRKMALYFSYELAKRNIAIVSGLAKGIDGFSHQGAILAKGKTIAVVGTGLDIVYPKEHVTLQQKILEQGGLILSEYPLGIGPDKNNFPARNRIISGISEGVFVIEAKEKSGTLITVDFALEQGKEVFAIPGNITYPNQVGTNRLIQEGAKCVLEVNDILEEYIGKRNRIKEL